MLRDMVALPIFMLFALCIFLGEKGREAYELKEQYKQELEKCDNHKRPKPKGNRD